MLSFRAIAVLLIEWVQAPQRGIELTGSPPGLRFQPATPRRRGCHNLREADGVRKPTARPDPNLAGPFRTEFRFALAAPRNGRQPARQPGSQTAAPRIRQVGAKASHPGTITPSPNARPTAPHRAKRPATREYRSGCLAGRAASSRPDSGRRAHWQLAPRFSHAQLCRTRSLQQPDRLGHPEFGDSPGDEALPDGTAGN